MPESIATAIRLPRLLAAKSARRALLAVGTVALAATLGFLYYKTQSADFKRQNEVLGLLRELKEIDARWDVDILRTRTDFSRPQTPSPDAEVALARIQRDLAAAAQTLDSPVLKGGLPDLAHAFSQKAGMVDQFKKANSAT